MIAIYVRLSIEDDESNSIENQIREGRDYANLNNYNEDSIKIYNEGLGVKGSTPIEERPALSKMMNDIKSGLIKIVYTRKQSRISRKLRMFNEILESMIEFDIQLYMGDRGLLDLKSPMTKMMLQIMSAFDEYAPNQQSYETKKSLLDNFNEGKVWGIFPYGYRTDDNMMPYVDDYEVSIVNRVFNDYLSGKSAHKISQELNKENVPSKYSQLNGELNTKNKYTTKIKTKSKDSIQWSEKTVKDMLSNSWYNGTRTFHKNVEGETPKIGEVPRIVNEILFNKVQNAIKARKGKINSTPKYHFLLKGLIRCEKCQRNYYGRFRPSKNDNFYMCSSKRKANSNCGNKSIHIPSLDSFIIKHLFKSKDLLGMMESIANNNEVLTSIESEIKTLEDELKTKNRKVNTYAKRLSDELKDDEKILNIYKNLTKQIKSIKELLIKLKIQRNDIINLEALNNYKQQITYINNESDFKTLKTAVNNIIENIRILSTVDVNDVDVYTILIEYKGLNEVSKFYTKQPYDKWIFSTLTTIDRNDELYSVNSELRMEMIYLKEEDIREFN